MEKKKRTTTAINPGIMAVGVTTVVIVALLCTWMYYATYAYPSTPDSPLTLVRIIIVCMGLAVPIVMLICPQRYFVWLTFTPEGIEYHTLARKKKLQAYSDFPFIMRGGYLHVVKPVEYIVMSNRRLKDDELYRINQVKPSSTLIRIQYSSRIFRKLVAVLPPKQRAMLTGAFHMHMDEL